MAVLYQADSKPYKVFGLHTTLYMFYLSRLFWKLFFADWILKNKALDIDLH